MQIDSHVRFIEHWDTDIVGQWKSAKNESKHQLLGFQFCLRSSSSCHVHLLFQWPYWQLILVILVVLLIRLRINPCILVRFQIHCLDFSSHLTFNVSTLLLPHYCVLWYIARPIMCVSDFEGQGAMKHLRHGQQPEGRPGIKGQPTLHPFWAAGFSFARGHFVIQIPYDGHLPMVFQGRHGWILCSS